jgi:hypothetical protein
MEITEGKADSIFNEFKEKVEGYVNYPKRIEEIEEYKELCYKKGSECSVEKDLLGKKMEFELEMDDDQLTSIQEYNVEVEDGKLLRLYREVMINPDISELDIKISYKDQKIIMPDKTDYTQAADLDKYI